MHLRFLCFFFFFFMIVSIRYILHFSEHHKSMEREMIGVTLGDRKTALWISEKTGAANILVDIRKKQYSWTRRVGLVVKMPLY